MPSYSKYPSAIDDSSTLPLSTDLVTEVKAEVVNRLRDSILKTQNELGINPSAEFGTVKDRLDDLQTQILNILSEIQLSNLIVFSCDSSLSVGNVVAQNGDSVIPANASSNLPAIGIIAQKPTPEIAYVKTAGEVTLSGLTPGEKYFLSEISGELNLTEPTTSGSFIQCLGFAKSSTIFVVQLSTLLIFI